LSFSSIRYHVLYDEAIKQCTERVVLALELNVACQNTWVILPLMKVKDKWIDIVFKKQNYKRGRKMNKQEIQ